MYSVVVINIVIFDVMTPDGVGIYPRQPALLKHLFHLRGSHVEKTSFFSKHVYSEDQHKSLGAMFWYFTYF